MKHKYKREKHERLWSKIERFMESGEILISKQVIIELYRLSDELSSWIKSFQSAIIDDTEDIQVIMAHLVNKYDGWINPESTKNQADPYVIAIAQVYEGTVVSSDGGGAPNRHFFRSDQTNKTTRLERMLKQASGIKIIDVCEEENVPWLDLVGFLVEQLPADSE